MESSTGDVHVVSNLFKSRSLGGTQWGVGEIFTLESIELNFLNNLFSESETIKGAQCLTYGLASQ